MRKRTQLVGFEFGYWKHVQYCAEFIDNALDAIESFQWREIRKTDSKFRFSLDQELFLEKLSILEAAKEEKKTQTLDNEAKHTLMQELGIESGELEEQEIKEPEIKEEESGEISNEAELEVEEEVRRIIDDMQEIIKPVENIIDLEPIVIVRIREYEAPSFLTSELSQKNVMSFIFEIFDNGTGMSRIDLRKFGKYLASSKSLELKQTRGSQGFGSPSAFSDAQNTTGKPIVAVSKTTENIYATVSEFFTTSKNEKKYLIHPTDVDSPFLHGTYIKLNYLNVKYIRGYVEKYVEETAFMNPHITVIYIDPYGKERIYRRLASSFPREPKYAKPHPSSVNIGDLQDLIAKSENNTISSFLKENFVRISSKTSKQIIEIAEKDLQDKISFLILKEGFVNIVQKKTQNIHFLKYEKRIFGRSTKPRDKLIIYKVDSEDLREKYWDIILKYIKNDKDQEKSYKAIQKFNNQIEKAEKVSEKRNIEKEKKKILNIIEKITNEKENIKLELNDLFKTNQTGLIELKKMINRNDFESLVNEVQLSKVKPADLTKSQFDSLFLAFKSIKYMAPPTDTAIPVGDSILENTLIKEIGLKISDSADDFDTPLETIYQTEEIIKKINQNIIDKKDLGAYSDLNENLVDLNDIVNLSSEILRHLNILENKLDPQQIKQNIDEILTITGGESSESYSGVYEYFTDNYTKDDDFVAAETRNPTSGKGLAYVVEAVIAYSKALETPKRSRDVLSRFVNRTPKLRDSADCAITKAVQSVNWKNYNLEVYDNGLPKGPIKLLVNVSGPFVHLMFKSQSKNALADDDELIKEMKYCLEAIGRRLRVYINRRENLYKNQKRASLIEKYIPKFAESVYNIASKGESKFKSILNMKEIIDLMKGAIGKKTVPIVPQQVISKEPEIKLTEIVKEDKTEKEILIKAKDVIRKEKPVKDDIAVPKIDSPKVIFSKKTYLNWTIKELKDYCKEKNIPITSKLRKADIVEKILASPLPKEVAGISKITIYEKPEKKEKILAAPTIVDLKPSKVSFKKPPIKPKSQPPLLKPKPVQSTLPIITTQGIMKVLSNEMQTIKHLIFKLKIKDMMDARYLQLKLKELERKGQVIVELRMGRKHWKLK
ncbi:hypothetical protein LCGC14_0657550 [marine sediment metagenome]|uniref:DNA topoisomerase VI subunit B transducer domain-containing protein n=1 Tax=marine sediment metagenome TaxID=412755 RepID=A0A0F9TG75_9ZZZZ|nr:MAG: DNA topoisomerase VI, subunit B [Candidatus Lokiarchaeum sp. GC14_75]